MIDHFLNGHVIYKKKTSVVSLLGNIYLRIVFFFVFVFFAWSHKTEKMVDIKDSLFTTVMIGATKSSFFHFH